MPSSPKLHGRSNQLSSLPRASLPVIVLCVLIGIAGFLFGLLSVLRTISVCSRPPRSVRVVWTRNSGRMEGVGLGKRHKVLGFVGIFTGFASTGRRRSLRKTWMPSDPQGLQSLEEATGLAFRFMIGRTKAKSKMSALRKEVAKYDDFVLLDLEEKYSKLPFKTLAFLKAAYALYDAEFYVKADDDIYLRPDRLSLLLAKDRSHSQTYLGCMKKGPVFTDPGLKWYEPLSYMLGKEYFVHAYGPLYALSADVVASLVALKNNSFRMFSNEDVTIGAWMLAMNVEHENNHELCAPVCTPSSIAVWDIPKCSGLCNPEKKLLQLHQNVSCSKSPTQQSDE